MVIIIFSLKLISEPLATALPIALNCCLNTFFNNIMLKAHNIEDDSRMNPEFADRIKQLDKEASYYRDECGKAQAEVDRLLDILKEVEHEKNDKDKKIAELER